MAYNAFDDEDRARVPGVISNDLKQMDMARSGVPALTRWVTGLRDKRAAQAAALPQGNLNQALLAGGFGSVFGLPQPAATPSAAPVPGITPDQITGQNQRELNRAPTIAASTAGATAPVESGSGIFRIGNTFTNDPKEIAAARAAGQTVTAQGVPLEGHGTVMSDKPGVVTGQRGSFSVIPSASMAGLDPALAAQLSAARSAAADRGDFEAVAGSYRAGGGTFNGLTQAQVDQQARQQLLQRMLSGAKTVSQLNSATNLMNAQMGKEAQQYNTDATARSAEAQRRQQLEIEGRKDEVARGKLDVEAFSAEANAEKAAEETRLARMRAEAAARIQDPSARAAATTGRTAGVPRPIAEAILPGAKSVPVMQPNGTIINTPIQNATQIQKVGGQWYKTVDGKAVPLSPAEAALADKQNK